MFHYLRFFVLIYACRSEVKISTLLPWTKVHVVQNQLETAGDLVLEKETSLAVCIAMATQLSIDLYCYLEGTCQIYNLTILQPIKDSAIAQDPSAVLCRTSREGKHSIQMIEK